MIFLLLSLMILSPFNAVIEGNATVGKVVVGPGQAFSLEISREYNVNGAFLGYYDYAFSPSPPEGFRVFPSKKFQNPLVVYISTPSYAQGTYKVPITLVDFYEGLENITFFVDVEVVRDVFDVVVEKKEFHISPNKPLLVNVELLNKLSLGDAFESIYVCFYDDGREIYRGNKVVYVNGFGRKQIPFEFLFNAEGRYKCNLIFRHLSSNITKKVDIDINVERSIINDIRALPYSSLLSYPMQQMPFSFLSLFSLLLS